MALDALLDAPQPIPPHAFAAMAAVVMGAAQLALPKGTLRHRIFGYAWVATLALVAASSFFIHSIRTFGAFSWIHLLSAFTLYSLVTGVRAVRRGDVAEHRSTMIQLYALALILAGAFTFLPGRIMHRVLFG